MPRQTRPASSPFAASGVGPTPQTSSPGPLPSWERTVCRSLLQCDWLKPVKTLLIRGWADRVEAQKIHRGQRRTGSGRWCMGDDPQKKHEGLIEPGSKEHEEISKAFHKVFDTWS